MSAKQLAIYHFSAKLISRKAGRSSVAAAAYRAGECLEDSRTGLVHDYTRRVGVLHKRLMVPGGNHRDREEFWCSVEHKNRRLDARTAREIEVSLPAELPHAQRVALADRFAQHLVRTYGIAADVCVHAPHRDGDQRNHHAHILTSTNLVNEDGSLGNKVRTLDGVARVMGGDAINAIDELRALWADYVNQALERGGYAQRVDHRSHEERGITEEPTIHLGPNVIQMEARAKRDSEHGGERYVPSTERMQTLISICEVRAQRLERFDAFRAAQSIRLRALRQRWEPTRARLLRTVDRVAGKAGLLDAQQVEASLRSRLVAAGLCYSDKEREAFFELRGALRQAKLEVRVARANQPTEQHVRSQLLAQMERYVSTAKTDYDQASSPFDRMLPGRLKQASERAQRALEHSQATLNAMRELPLTEWSRLAMPEALAVSWRRALGALDTSELAEQLERRQILEAQVRERLRGYVEGERTIAKVYACRTGVALRFDRETTELMAQDMDRAHRVDGISR
ncbi:MAG: hypothetical protein CMP06_12935 [Xanthomonadales bacterium]|nr:hypothetical protein [Xanthomonadales bacterium]